MLSDIGVAFLEENGSFKFNFSDCLSLNKKIKSSTNLVKGNSLLLIKFSLSFSPGLRPIISIPGWGLLDKVLYVE